MTDVRRLPGPVVEKWDWQLHGACRGHDSGLFFHPDGDRGPTRAAREDAAKAICATCPVIASCAAHALATREPYGVWGGMTEGEREAIGLGERHAIGASVTAGDRDAGERPGAHAAGY